MNPKYGSAPGRLICTHVADQCSPLRALLVSLGTRNATFFLDGLLRHKSELRIREHHADEISTETMQALHAKVSEKWQLLSARRE